MASDDDTWTGRSAVTPRWGGVPEAPCCPAVDVLPVGASLGPYVLERALGGGGGGAVYAARHRLLGRRVAIKVLRADMAKDPVMVTRFLLEATAVNKIGHPNIVDIHEFGEAAPGRPYYVMELLEGMDLSKYLLLHGRFTVQEALTLVEPVCDAVQAAHEAGFIHRDIKANNIVVVESSRGLVVKLLDFGIAKTFQSDAGTQALTEPGVRLGTAHNMAPEQVRCEAVDARADLYAIGVLLYQLLTGQYPFDSRDPHQIAVHHLHTPPPRPSAIVSLPPAVDAVVLRCLQKRPEQRFDSVRELLGALRSAANVNDGVAAQEQSSAVGVYFEVSTGPGAELDDTMCEDISNVLDTLEHGLSSLAFALPLRTSASLLGVRLVADNSDVECERRAAQLAISNLRATLAGRVGRHPAIEISAAVSVERALCQTSPHGVEVVGGPILDIETWTVHQLRPRLPST